MTDKARRQRRSIPITPAARPAPSTNVDAIPKERRRAIFAALAAAFAEGTAPDDARYAVARRFVLTIVKVEAIEREGLTNKWPRG